MKFEGDKLFTIAPLALWTQLRDARFLVQCIPDAFIGEPGDISKAGCVVRPGFSFVRGSLDVVVEIAEAVEEKSIRLVVTSKGIGSSSEVGANMIFSPEDKGTRLHWTGEITRLGGLLKAVPAGLIRGAALKVIEDVWTTMATKINS